MQRKNLEDDGFRRLQKISDGAFADDKVIEAYVILTYNNFE